MARKTLLTESEIRQFMKLADIKPLQEMGGSYGMPPGIRDDEEEEPPAARDYMQEQEEEELEMDAEEAPAPEGGEELEMDAELDAPAPEGDVEMDMGAEDDLGGMDMEGGKEEQFADIVDKLADLLGLDADVEVGGEEEMELGGEVVDDEGGDLEGAMDAPEGDDEDMGVEVEDDEEIMGEEEIVQEVARRVAARLIREKKQDDMANKLAERIFRRLASK